MTASPSPCSQKAPAIKRKPKPADRNTIMNAMLILTAPTIKTRLIMPAASGQKASTIDQYIRDVAEVKRSYPAMNRMVPL